MLRSNHFNLFPDGFCRYQSNDKCTVVQFKSQFLKCLLYAFSLVEYFSNLLNDWKWMAAMEWYRGYAFSIFLLQFLLHRTNLHRTMEHNMQLNFLDFFFHVKCASSTNKNKNSILISQLHRESDYHFRFFLFLAHPNEFLFIFFCILM